MVVRRPGVAAMGRPRRAHSGRPAHLRRLGAGHRGRPRGRDRDRHVAGARRAPHRRRPAPAAAHLAPGGADRPRRCSCSTSRPAGRRCRWPSWPVRCWRRPWRSTPAVTRAERSSSASRRSAPSRLGCPTGGSLDDALADARGRLGREPVGSRVPTVLADTALLPLPDGVRTQVVDATGAAVPLLADAVPWGALALTGGRPTMLFGELERTVPAAQRAGRRRAGGGVTPRPRANGGPI